MTHDGVHHEQRGNGLDDRSRALMHELSNALTRILSSSEFIEEAARDDPQTLRDARTVRTAALESRELLQHLRDHLARGSSE
ncbi:MAG: hypothetical protein ACOC1I_07815 [Spirochaetota bacterium]